MVLDRFTIAALSIVAGERGLACPPRAPTVGREALALRSVEADASADMSRSSTDIGDDRGLDGRVIGGHQSFLT
jgi:hypothetical protein